MEGVSAAAGFAVLSYSTILSEQPQIYKNRQTMLEEGGGLEEYLHKNKILPAHNPVLACCMHVPNSILIRSLLLLYAGSVLLPVQAQQQDSRSRFTLKAGYLYSVMNFNAGSPPPSTSVKNNWKPGFYLGGGLQVPLAPSISLMPEYAYTRMQGFDTRTGITSKFQYLTLPVLLKVAAAQRFAVVAGPAFGLLIRASQQKSGVAANTTHDTEERSVSAIGGLEFNITHGLFFEARYQHGLNHIGLGQRSAVTEFKWRSASLGLGWHL